MVWKSVCLLGAVAAGASADRCGGRILRLRHARRRRTGAGSAACGRYGGACRRRHPIAEPIAVDGVLDEPAWRTAPPIGELVQRQPIEGAAPSERTTVTLLADADRLYIGVIAYDDEPARVLGTQMARDAALGADDRIEILLDTFRDQRSAFYFATNPSGALRRRPARQRPVEHRLGRDLGRPHAAHDGGLGRRVRDPVQEPQLPDDALGVGLQRRPPRLSQARGEPLVGRAPRLAVRAGRRGGRDHRPGRPDAGHRPRRAAVPGRPLAAPGRRRRRPRASRGSTCSTTSRRASS